MKPVSLFPAFLALCFFLCFRPAAHSAPATSAPAPAAQPPRVASFDRAWRFHWGDLPGAEAPAFSDADWRSVNLPHDWMIEGHAGSDPAAMDGPFDQSSPAGSDGAYLNGGVGWYRKTFTLPASARGKRVTLLFDGAYMDADVWLNGVHLGNHPYGFTSFFYDLTPHLRAGSNIVAVRLNDQQPSCRWYSGAGLYRHVWLVATSPVHLAQWGTYITTPTAAATGASVRVRTQAANDGPARAPVTLTTTLYDPDGKPVGRQSATLPAAAGASAQFDQTFSLRFARLWSLSDPALYHAVSTVTVKGSVTDTDTTPFGIRAIAFTRDRGFLLNGIHVPIYGVCDHHDLGCLGSAAYRRGIERQLQILKGMGCNAIRTSHNPPSPELLDLCDKMGFVVMDEAFDEWKASHKKFGYGRFFDQWSEPDIVSMLDRDRNHPSIVLWSIGNEISEGASGNPVAGPLAQRLAAICHREDPTRPVTSACPAPDNDWKSGLAQALDIFGVNYNTGFYDRNKPGSVPPANPDRYQGQLPMIASETASQVDTRGEYGLSVDTQGMVQIDPRPANQLSCYDLYHPGWGCSAETDLLALKNAPWLAGEFVWSGFDYLGETTPYSWPSRSSYFGLIDLAGFPKDRYYLYKSQWSAQPVVHILPSSWTWPGFEGKAIPVRVFTNADTVELFLNGASLGAQTFVPDAKQLHLEWSVPYAPGALKAVATKNGKVVATEELRTAGPPAVITLRPDRARIAADGQDLSFVTVTVQDKDGTVCPNADTEIRFAVSGPADIAGLDNGDETNHEPFQGTQHQAFHGRALVVLKSRYAAPGTVTLTASAEGLPSVSATMTVK